MEYISLTKKGTFDKRSKTYKLLQVDVEQLNVKIRIFNNVCNPQHIQRFVNYWGDIPQIIDRQVRINIERGRYRYYDRRDYLENGRTGIIKNLFFDYSYTVYGYRCDIMGIVLMDDIEVRGRRYKVLTINLCKDCSLVGGLDIVEPFVIMESVQNMAGRLERQRIRHEQMIEQNKIKKEKLLEKKLIKKQERDIRLKLYIEQHPEDMFGEDFEIE